MKTFFAKTLLAQGLVEYALLLALVALVVIVILAYLGPSIGSAYSNIMSAV